MFFYKMPLRLLTYVTNGDNICSYLTILEVEVAFINSICAEAESRRNSEKGIDAEIRFSKGGLGLYRIGTELSAKIIPVFAGELSKVVVLEVHALFDLLSRCIF